MYMNVGYYRNKRVVTVDINSFRENRHITSVKSGQREISNGVAAVVFGGKLKNNITILLYVKRIRSMMVDFALGRYGRMKFLYKSVLWRMNSKT